MQSFCKALALSEEQVRAPDPGRDLEETARMVMETPDMQGAGGLNSARDHEPVLQSGVLGGSPIKGSGA